MCPNCGNPDWTPVWQPQCHPELPAKCPQCGCKSTGGFSDMPGVMEPSTWDDPRWARPGTSLEEAVTARWSNA